MGKLNIGRWILAGVIAAAVVHGTAITVINADRRSYAKGREFGQCEVVIALDIAMRKEDPTWVAPPKLIKRCDAALAGKEPFDNAPTQQHPRPEE